MLSTIGQPIPDTAHAVSVSLPSWKSTIGYEGGEDWVLSKMRTGYPRFFIHPIIQELEREILAGYGQKDELTMLFPSFATAIRCQAFLLNKEPSLNSANVRIINLVPLAPEKDSVPEIRTLLASLSCVFFPSQYFKLAKQVWQHSGDGISSRRGEFYLTALLEGLLHPEEDRPSPQPKQSRTSRGPRRYQKKDSLNGTEPDPSDALDQQLGLKKISMHSQDYSQFVEERFGRNLNADLAVKAKIAIRRRIAGCLTEDMELDTALESSKEVSDDRASGLTEDDVYLYPSGMSSIFNTHRILMASGDQGRKSVCFGFPYIDTLKVLEKWGCGCLFYGHGSDSDLDDLQRRLEQGERYLAVFTEVPGNPLLNTPNLQRIRSLADKYDFILVVDETIGNFINVNALTRADVVVSSLTKVFSGDSNVMGGSAVLNPNGGRYQRLKDCLDAEYEDNYWAEDALFMERNSRDFISRIGRVNVNAEVIADVLHSSPLVKEVYYPKYRPSKVYYDEYRNANGGYGGLLSVTFRHVEEAVVFFDALEVEKGPSLGTNFTLSCPYTILAHYDELDWAGQFGIDPGLVRISVGLERTSDLKAIFEAGLQAVEKLCLGEKPAA